MEQRKMHLWQAVDLIIRVSLNRRKRKENIRIVIWITYLVFCQEDCENHKYHLKCYYYYYPSILDIMIVMNTACFSEDELNRRVERGLCCKKMVLSYWKEEDEEDITWLTFDSFTSFSSSMQIFELVEPLSFSKLLSLPLLLLFSFNSSKEEEDDDDDDGRWIGSWLR